MKLKRFTDREIRWDFYSMFLNLMRKGFEIEAFILILSTWNFARFRYAVRSFNLDKFKDTIKKLSPIFKKFEKCDFKTINFDKYEEDIKKVFETLAAIKGIEKTGAPKLMHLKVPKVFVMWDMYIRKYYGFNTGDADDYFNFLKKMQGLFKEAKIPKDRTLAKYIDEHNFKTITTPALKELEFRNKK